MKCAVKDKEDALNKERTEFMDMILELINVIKIQKRRICEVTGICNNQQHTLHEKDNELCQKVRQRVRKLNLDFMLIHCTLTEY